jgi:hypothetical protein
MNKSFVSPKNLLKAKSKVAEILNVNIILFDFRIEMQEICARVN